MLKTQIWYFIKVAVTPLFLYDNMLESALDKVVAFAGEVLFERKPSTSIKPEATLDERIDLRRSDQPEVPQTPFLTSSLTRQVFNSPDKSMPIADLIKNYAHKETENVDYCPVSLNVSEIHAEENATWLMATVTQIYIT